MNPGKLQTVVVSVMLMGWFSHLSSESAVAETGPVSDPDVSCVAIDFYDMAHRTTSTTGQVQEHQSSPVYPTGWTGEISIPWQPDHDSANDPILMQSFVKDGLRLTGTSALGDAWVEFELPATLPEHMRYTKELFFFATAINARPGLSVGKTLGVIDLTFKDGLVKTYELKIGHNVRNWWSGTYTVPYVFNFTPGSDPEAREIDWAAANGGEIGLDVARISLPAKYRLKSLLTIRVTAKPVVSYSRDVSLRLSGISTFYKIDDVVDPNPSLMNGAAVTTDLDRLASGGKPVNGLAADGVTPVVLRSHVPGPGEVMFTITTNGTAEEVGTLQSIGGDETGTILSVPTTELSNGQYTAFAILTAPLDFCRDPSDYSRTTRPISIQGEFTPAAGGPPVLVFSRDIDLYRPPVMLLHGLWSKSRTWTWDWVSNVDSPFEVYPKDYSLHEGASKPFSDNISKARKGVVSAVKKLRSQGIAATQADVIGHSMGGLLSRLYIADVENNYFRDDNFGVGDIHKLVTVDTPHQGSGLANALVREDGSLTELGSMLDRGFSLFRLKLRVAGGAIFDMRRDSYWISTLPAADVPAHAIAGDGGHECLQQLCIIRGSRYIPHIREAFFLLGQAIEDALGTEHHDVIVELVSQLGGLSGAYTTTVPFSSDNHAIHISVTGDEIVGERVVELLNEPVHGSSFAEGFPPAPFRSRPRTAEGRTLVRTTGAIEILSPQPGTIVTPGSTISVTVSPIGEYAPLRVAVMSNLDAAGDDAAPFEVMLTVPEDAIGEVHLLAVAIDADGNIAESDRVILTVDFSAALTRTSVTPDPVYLFSYSLAEGIRVMGTYDDGLDRDLTASGLGTTYTVSDPTIATVDSEGVITARRVGWTTLTATNDGYESTARVVVVTVHADADSDGDVDLRDVSALQDCFSAAKELPGFVLPSVECRDTFDVDSDGDVDLLDFAEFDPRFDGPE